MMSNVYALVAFMIGLRQLRKRARLARGLYAIRDAGMRAAEGMRELQAAADAITAALYTPNELRARL
jgi:hypothetical protein